MEESLLGMLSRLELEHLFSYRGGLSRTWLKLFTVLQFNMLFVEPK